jgi:hypothetical protein
MVGLGVPLSLIGSLGTEGEETAPPVLHRRFDTQRLLSKKTARMGDEGKAAGCVSPAALLSLNSAFLCWPSLRKTSVCSQICVRLASQG